MNWYNWIAVAAGIVAVVSVLVIMGCVLLMALIVARKS